MTAVLPATYTVRPPTNDDAKAVFDLVAAYNTAVIGVADYTLDDMVDELTDPGFAPETDGWLVFDGDRLTGYGSVFVGEVWRSSCCATSSPSTPRPDGPARSCTWTRTIRRPRSTCICPSA